MIIRRLLIDCVPAPAVGHVVTALAGGYAPADTAVARISLRCARERTR